MQFDRQTTQKRRIYAVKLSETHHIRSAECRCDAWPVKPVLVVRCARARAARLLCGVQLGTITKETVPSPLYNRTIQALHSTHILRYAAQY